MTTTERNKTNIIVKSIFFISVFFILISCDNRVQKQTVLTSTLLWVNQTHDDNAIKKAVKYTLENNSLVIAQISWSPTDSTFFKNIAWYKSLAKDHHKKLMIAVDWQTPQRTATIGNKGFDNLQYKNQFIFDMEKISAEYEPDYFNLGVEVNYYALYSNKGFKSFASCFRELKNRLTKKKPNIKIGLSYQLELLFGNQREWGNEKTIEPLENLAGDLDFIGISTYPNLINELSQNRFSNLKYLDTLKSYYTIPMGISETSISSKIFNSKERELYVKAVFKKLDDLNLRFLIWGSMIDNVNKRYWFDYSGLLEEDGTEKSEFKYWKYQINKY